MAVLEGLDANSSFINRLPEEDRQAIAAGQEREAEQIAQETLKVGDNRFRGDNDHERAEHFAQVLTEHNPQFRQQILAEVLERDDGATRSWFKPEVFNDLAAEGRISNEELRTAAETYAKAYNDGLFETYEVPANTTLSGDPSVTHDVSQIDSAVSRFHTSSGSGVAFEGAQDVRELTDFINASNGPEAREFRETYSEHLIQDYVLVDQVDSQRRSAAAGIAAEFLSQDPQVAAKVLNNLDDAQLKTFFEQAARSDSLFSEHILQSRANDRALDVSDIALDDGVSGLLNALSGAHGTNVDEVSGRIARLADNAPDIFSDRYSPVAEQRVEAFGKFFSEHAEPILDTLTSYPFAAGDRSLADPNSQVIETNARDLSAALALTVYNTDSPYQAASQAAIEDYAAEQVKIINDQAHLPNSPGYEDASNRLVLLSAANNHAVTRGFEEVASSLEQQRELVGLVFDVLLAGVPLGDRIGSKLETAITDNVAEGIFRDALTGVGGDLVDRSTGKLTDTAKAEILDSLTGDERDLLNQQELEGLIVQGLTAGIIDEEPRGNIRRDIGDLARDL